MAKNGRNIRQKMTNITAKIIAKIVDKKLQK